MIHPHWPGRPRGVTMRRLSVPFTVGLAAVALLAAACGSSGSSSSTKPKAVSTSPTAAATGGRSGNAIMVGGLQDGNFPGIDTGFEARIARLNPQGGLDGPKIKVAAMPNAGSSLSTEPGRPPGTRPEGARVRGRPARQPGTEPLVDRAVRPELDAVHRLGHQPRV